MSFKTTQESDACKIDSPEEEVIITTLPQSRRDEIRRDGETKCLCTGWLKRRILSTPGFPSPIVHPPKVAYEVRKTAGRGLGVFALDDIDACDLIVATGQI